MQIDILTVSLNPGNCLSSCLDSVAGQIIPGPVKIRHHVRDGGSTDGSLQTLGKWQEENPSSRSFVSGKDRGLYDALNLAIQETKGEIVGLLHADDVFFDPHVLSRVAQAFADPSTSIVYGDLVYFKEDARTGSRRITRYWRSGPGGAAAFRWGWMPPHPTVFVRREIFRNSGSYRTDFGSAADYEWLLRLFSQTTLKSVHIPAVFVAMRTGGLSNRSFQARLAANANDRRAWRVNGLRPWPWTLLFKPIRKFPQWFLAQSISVSPGKFMSSERAPLP